MKKLFGQIRDPKHKKWLQALIDSCDGPRLLAQRYSKEAKRLAAEESNPKRKEELLEISKICSRVPWEPANTFWEAVCKREIWD